MRIKLVVLATVIAALAVGVATSSATLRTETSAKVTIPKAGSAATVKIVIDNTDNEVVPQRISMIKITSKDAKFNAKAVPQCKSTVPTNAAGNNNAAEITPACPKASRVGKGTAIVNTGTVGQPFPPDLATITADINVYNYKPSGGDQAALLFEIMSDVPVQNAHQYQLAHVSKAGVISSTVPNTTDLPPAVQQFLTGRTTSLAHLETTIKSPKAKKGKKPFFTLKSVKNIDFSVVLERDHG
jgi:hypothetical protein